MGGVVSAVLAAIPVVGWIILIYWAVQPGEAGANTYGPPPETTPVGTVVVPGQQ